MTVRLDGEIIRLVGACHVEEAEPLLGLLQAGPRRRVDVGECRYLHTSIVQVLLAFASPLDGEPADPFLRDFVIPALSMARAGERDAGRTRS